MITLRIRFLILACLIFHTILAAQQPIGLQVAENQIILFGDDTASLSTKLLWLPGKGALFAGNLLSPLDSIGEFSFATGRSIATKLGAFATGQSSARGTSSVAFGNSGAVGNFSLATGFSTTFGALAVATGNSSSNGYASVAMGLSVATANTSVALGNARANGMTSTALNLSRADAFMATTVGRYNIGGGSNTTFNSLDPIFEVGIGSSETNRRNALTILKNGQVFIPNGNDASLSLNGFLTLGNPATFNIVMDDNELMARNNGAASTLFINRDGGDVEFFGAGQGAFIVRNIPTGDYGNMQYDPVSDRFFYDNSSRRYKENITPLQDDWTKILQVQPVTYTRPGNPGRWEYGYIAEEIDSIGLTTMVGYDADGIPEDVRYDKMILYLVEMLKIQQEEFKLQQQKLEMQQRKIDILEEKCDARE